MKQSKSALTRKVIQMALLRLKNNRPKIVTQGRKISIASVAEEAGISRATIHNNYPDLAEIIREINNKSSRVQCNEKRQQLKVLENKNNELRSAVQGLNLELARIASLNASLLLENTRLQTIINNRNISFLRK
jgi:AcrR family transcriptional regulator